MSFQSEYRTRMRAAATAGFTLIEVMIVVAIVAILAAVAWPIYQGHVVRTNRVAAESCLSEYSNYMERYYTTNLRYDQDSAGTANTLAAANLDCASAGQTGKNYAYAFSTGSLTASAYTIEATPNEPQKTRDATCGTLTLDQTGKRGIQDATGTVAGCWR